VDVVFYATSDLAGSAGYSSSTMVKVGPDVTSWANGVSYMCHPGVGDIVATLNTGLAGVMADGSYNTLCAKSDYSAISCLSSSLTFSGNKLAANADIIIGMEADFGDYNNINAASTLVGMDVELTAMVCDKANVKCAVMTAPWQSMIPAAYPTLGWSDNQKTYPGIGFNREWFDCSSGSRNTIPRQQSLTFSNPYTDPTADLAEFFTLKGNTMADDASDVIVGVQAGYAATAYLVANYRQAKEVKFFTTAATMFAALTDGTVNVIFYATNDVAGAAGYDAGTMEKVGPPGNYWSNGVSFMCNPRSTGSRNMLNTGLMMTLGSPAWATVADTYSSIPALKTAMLLFQDPEDSVGLKYYETPLSTGTEGEAGSGVLQPTEDQIPEGGSGGLVKDPAVTTAAPTDATTPAAEGGTANNAKSVSIFLGLSIGLPLAFQVFAHMK
jgi:arginine/ornithine transport system substrate-binding protein